MLQIVLRVSLLLLFLVGPAFAATQEVILEGRTAVTVTQPFVSLGDVADVSSRVAGNDDAIIALKKIRIAESPLPGAETTVTASTILDALRANGVNTDAVGYRFPRVISVQRAGRKVLQQELRAVIEEVLKQSDRDISLRALRYDEDIAVTPGDIEMSASMFQTNKPGELGFSFEVESDKKTVQQFDVFATVEEWREIPVATRSIRRGSVIDVNDVRMARYNVSALPGDVALEPNSVYGLEASKNISFGEVFQKRKLSIPPVVEMGDIVTLVYRSAGIEATASGVAIESGAEGDEIRVRNDSSRKIVLGKVLEPGLIGVGK